MIRVLKFFLKLISILLLFVGILFLASKLLEQKIVEKAITIMNNEVDVPIHIDKISFSLIKQFPHASLQLNGVTILSAKDFNQRNFTESFPDTLVFIEELYLSVNLRSLMDNRLDVTKAYAHKGQVNMLVDKKGKENFRILKQTKEKLPENETKKNLAFLLEQIQIEQIEFRFINKFKNTAISIYAPSYTMKGEFYKTDYSAFTSGKLLLNYFEHGQIKIHPKNPAKINMNLNVSNNIVEIVESSLETKEFQFSLNGTINLNEPIDLNLKIKGNTDNLDGFIGFFTDKNPKRYSTSGQLAISAAIKGIIDNKRTPAVAVNFKLVNGSFRDDKQDFNINSIALLGTYTNGMQRNLSSSRIDIEKFSLEVKKSSLSGQFSIHNFSKPLVTLSAKTSLQLIDLDPLISNNGSYYMEGKADGEIYCQGTFDTKNKLTLVDFQNWQKKASFNVSDGVFNMKKPQLNIEGLSGNVEILNNKITFNSLEGKVQTSNMKADAFIDDYFTMLMDSLQPINIVGTLKADQVFYKDFEQFFEIEDSESETRDINVKGSFETEKCYYEKIVAEKVSGKIDYFNEQMRITDLKFKTMEGQVSGSVNYFTQSDNKYLFQTHTETNHVNIKSFFSAYDNFNQTFITDKNIDGYLTSNFEFEMMYKGDDIVTSSIELMGHVRIDNGKLINFEPIREISKYSDVEEVNDIEFSKLENDILISKSTVHIPKMDISSNLFDLSLYGTQQFSGDYEYHIQLNLSDFLGGKSKRLAKQHTEFGNIEDDENNSTTLFLLATYINGVSKVKLDGDEIKGKFKKNANEEKKEFKKVLHNEFGWFKNDTTLKEPEKKTKKPAFEIEWDEE